MFVRAQSSDRRLERVMNKHHDRLCASNARAALRACYANVYSTYIRRRAVGATMRLSVVCMALTDGRTDGADI